MSLLWCLNKETCALRLPATITLESFADFEKNKHTTNKVCNNRGPKAYPFERDEKTALKYVYSYQWHFGHIAAWTGKIQDNVYCRPADDLLAKSFYPEKFWPSSKYCVACLIAWQTTEIFNMEKMLKNERNRTSSVNHSSVGQRTTCDQ